MNHLLPAASQFVPAETILDISPYGSGNINDTYIVRTRNSEKIILQRLNAGVFGKPRCIMHNLRRLGEHMRKKCSTGDAGNNGRPWRIVHIVPTRAGQDFFVDEHDSFWRALTFIGNTVAPDTVSGPRHAREAGFALGRFHRLVNDLDINSLYDPLENFHITPSYLQQFRKTERNRPKKRATAETAFCRRFIADRKEWAGILEKAKQDGMLPLRPIHGDPKVSNILLDAETGQAVALVDLDTVKPGLIHYDIGDCLRSCCNRAGEEAANLAHVAFDADLCKAVLTGYFSEAKSFLTDNDQRYLFDAIRLLAFELGLRFFTDYLAGDVYFKARFAKHNLQRALVQFRLTESIEAQEARLRALIAELGEATFHG